METAATVYRCSAVESAATMHGRSTVEITAAVKAFSAAEASDRSTLETAPATEVTIVVEIPPAAVIEVATAPESGAPMEPRPRADEDSAVEPLRPVVSIRSAGVRSIWIISVSANRSTHDHRPRRADSNSNHDSLCMRERRSKQDHSKHCENS
jgi:hypothetical protein